MPAHGSSGPADIAQPIDANAFIAFEAAGWERQAPTYGDFLGQITRQFVPALLDAAGVVSGLKVLDLATGPGYAAGMAARRGASVIGVDSAEAMVQLARRGHPDLDFRVADAEALPFSDGTFDVLVSNFVVPHLGRPERALGELARVLRPGGRLALTTWDQPARMRLLGTFLEAFGESGAMPPASLPVGPPFSGSRTMSSSPACSRVAG
ncbi:MAG TPA: class I SAM-dependent methyltransferase [Propionibacteriaceae bacterium]|nr:class I SAM-dependent methyltransferase [Propionibacteriaceae bacterium]